MKPSTYVCTLMTSAFMPLCAAGAATLAVPEGQRLQADGPSKETATAMAPASALPDFTQITAQDGPAVVNITVNAQDATSNGEASGGPATHNRGVPDAGQNDPIFDYFLHSQGPFGSMPGHNPVLSNGLGSGFLVGKDGVILTNAHLVYGARIVVVKLTDRREFHARILGIDAKTDVAVLKIEAQNLPTLHLGSADELQVGQWVLAIGSPFGFDNTVTAGVVSANLCVGSLALGVRGD